MSKPLWPPTPWRAVRPKHERDVLIRDADDVTIAVVSGLPVPLLDRNLGETAPATADLLVAAPALYRALRRIVREKQCERQRRGQTSCAAAGPKVNACRICQARSAMRLAGGER